jgi:hypothetical protein
VFEIGPTNKTHIIFYRVYILYIEQFQQGRLMLISALDKAVFFYIWSVKTKINPTRQLFM